MKVQLQTLQGFLRAPFGGPAPKIPPEWETLARRWFAGGKFKLQMILEMDDCYFYNIEVPSESHPNLHYDVVIQFIPNDSKAPKKDNVQHYYVKFFSNSPSFVYKYAALYYANGMLIDALAAKLGANYKNPPEKTNPGMTLGIDKSIFMASRYLIMTNFLVGYKDIFRQKRTKDINKFLNGVLEFDTMMNRIDVENFKKSAEKQLKKDKDQAKKQGPPKKIEEKKAARPGVIMPKAKIGPKKPKSPLTPLAKVAKKSKILATKPKGKR